MSLPEIRDEWGVPARIGQRVAVYIPGVGAFPGTITGSAEGMIVADFDDFPAGSVVHPRGISYVPADFDPKDYR